MTVLHLPSHRPGRSRCGRKTTRYAPSDADATCGFCRGELVAWARREVRMAIELNPALRRALNILRMET